MKSKPVCRPNASTLLAALVALGIAAHAGAASPPEERRLDELRNTVINLLQGLVERGVLSRDQAAGMVSEAQEKAATDAAAQAAQDAEEAGAVRVPHVPEIVKEEIRRQVAADLGADVTKQVVEAAQAEGWGVPAALPDWVKRMRWYGDVRIRAQGDLFAADNSTSAYYNYQLVNERGGIGAAGIAAALNTTEDRQRLRGRLRFGFESVLGYGWNMGAQLATGNLRDPVSTNQTLGNYAARYQSGIDLAYLNWQGTSRTGRHALGLQGGRIRNPWITTDLVFDQDLTFEGVAANYRFGLRRDDFTGSHVFATAGAFPLQEVEIGSDKWLLGGQLGVNWKFADSSRIRLAAALLDFRRVAGEPNAFGSTLNDYTAPQYLQKGNTLFDIRNDSDPNTNLYALASDYRLLDFNSTFEWRLTPGVRFTWYGNYVRNIGFNVAQVQSRLLVPVEKKNKGYQTEFGVGSVDMARHNAWRFYAGYRYVERDAVLDAFTDSDFRLGGTDAKGYFAGFDWALTPMVQARMRYMSGNEIDGPVSLLPGLSLDPALGIDVLQFDITASF